MQRDAGQHYAAHGLVQRIVPPDVLAGAEDMAPVQHEAAVDCVGGLIEGQARAHGGGEGVHPFRRQVQLGRAAQGLQLHGAAQRDVVGAAAGHLLRRCAPRRQRVGEVDTDLQPLGTAVSSFAAVLVPDMNQNPFDASAVVASASKVTEGLFRKICCHK